MPEQKLISEEQLKNAKIYQSRWSWAKQLPNEINFLEVGVGGGDFSHFIANNVKLKNLYLLDKYNHNDYRTGWDQINGMRFNSESHYSFIKDKFKNFNNVTMLKGFSEIIMDKLIKENNIKFDVVYLDTDHTRDQLKKEVSLALKLLNPDGILAFNDYIVFAENNNKYETISVVVDFLNDNKDWEVVGFALDTYMYCDIYLKRIIQKNENTL